MRDKVNRLAEALRKKAAVYFYYTAKPRYFNPIDLRRRYNEAAAKKELRRNRALWEYLSGVIAASGSLGCSFVVYRELYESVLSHAPKYILELGSGVTSCVIAFAVKELHERTGNNTVFVSMEEDPFFYSQIREIIPRELRDHVSFVLAERKEKTYSGMPGCYYENIPEYPYDFVFIDGPTLRAAPGSRKCFSADLINLIMRDLSSVNGILDQRINAYWAYKKFLPAADIRYDSAKRITIIKNATKDNMTGVFFERHNEEGRE